MIVQVADKIPMKKLCSKKFAGNTSKMFPEGNNRNRGTNFLFGRPSSSFIGKVASVGQSWQDVVLAVFWHKLVGGS